MATYRITLKHMYTGDKPYKCDIHVYVVKCLVIILTYRHTLEHIQVITLINVMCVVKGLVRMVAYRITYRS